ncbi:hypothetical protein NPIL_35331 [Nephila pilipes]|uniref:Uncharacterized protein n=1 Tax=Nephila pilipes TaxID=299642 RepID=A0A8X6Q515_NEPPI|nr:hypothetical protein NPIL_35331 [Nephila pilipes]
MMIDNKLNKCFFWCQWNSCLRAHHCAFGHLPPTVRMQAPLEQLEVIKIFYLFKLSKDRRRGFLHDCFSGRQCISEYFTGPLCPLNRAVCIDGIKTFI